ncbi:MAG TPA: ATP synthase F0 subunit C [Candidatus Stercoripulliclostridium merdipullorum]|uniref:ATP synthase subunit c n=1 Tax=Candidatus Stercoripulliclostridium merdipullorum TaxID=2840952 RepID=A0A9D1NCG6_9FIRM|nr:ATP synthase F0 subunit C [Candidatus Stercoripulliclostridium merdipullorum]
MNLMFLASDLAALGAALAIGLTGLGAALAMGFSISKAMEGIARQPEADNKIRSTLILGLAFCETLAIYGLLVAILLLTM